MEVVICSGKEKLCIDDIQDMLSKTIWSPGITKKEILKGIDNSALIVGAYNEDGTQIGFMLVVSDKTRFAYLMDVVVNENYRRQGIGTKMLNFALSHPELKDVYQWFLMTADAHGVYEKCGFEPINNPERLMSIIKPRPDRSNYEW